MRTGRRIRTLALCALLAACSSVFRQSDVRLEGVRLGGIGLSGGTVVALLHVENPNSYGLEARAFSYDLQLRNLDADDDDAWVPLAAGTIERALQVAGHSETVLEIPIEFRYSDLGPAVRSLLDRGTFDYRVSGQVAVTEPVTRMVPFRKTGKVTLQGVR